MSRIRGRAKRWFRKIRNARWRCDKKDMLARGWVEIAENTLVPGCNADIYAPYVPTHLRGRVG